LWQLIQLDAQRKKRVPAWFFVHCRQLETLGSDSLNVADRAAFDALIRAFASTQQVALREFTASP
jgi:hypothetical protein